MRIPILTYHAANVAGHSYEQNDHIALAQDLQLIHDLGFRVVRLRDVIDHMLGRVNHDLYKAVALTCDDGCDLEVNDADYPGVGWQPSFLSILKAAHDKFGTLPCMSSFVIADPAARKKMDETCLFGKDWLSDTWWLQAASEKYFTIESHAWDHNHAVLGEHGFDGMPTGSFLDIDSDQRAQYQLDQSIDFINKKIMPDHVRFFAYPYGHVAEYLRSHYLPSHANRLGLHGAFSTEPGYVCNGSDPWNLPRFVCGWHWKSSEQLKTLLLAALD